MAKKYAVSVEEAKMHGQHTSPFLSLQFGLIVSKHGLSLIYTKEHL